jgi:cysteine-rich repeat protein
VQVCTQVGTNYYVLVSAAGPGALGGTYTLSVTSNGVACGNPPPPPANDECANAIQVFDGVTQTTNAFATTSAPPGPTCAGGGAVNSERDVWFTYTATCSGLLTVDTCATQSAVNDTILSVYEGTCGNLQNEVCDEDGCGIAFLSTVTTAAVQGQTYIIRVASFLGSPDGPFTLTIGCTPAKFVCGDGIVDPGEECDDGNNVPNDGCTDCEGDPCEAFPLAACTGTADTEPCHVNGDVSGLDPNGGCNSTPNAFGTIAVGEKKCGTISTYTNSLGAAVRDTDWFSFTAPVSGFYTARVCSSFTPQCLFLIAPPCPAVLVGAGAAGTPNVPLFVTRELTQDTVYTVFVSRLGGTGDVACPPPGTFNYTLQLTQP